MRFPLVDYLLRLFKGSASVSGTAANRSTLPLTLTRRETFASNWGKQDGMHE